MFSTVARVDSIAVFCVSAFWDWPPPTRSPESRFNPHAPFRLGTRTAVICWRKPISPSPPVHSAGTLTSKVWADDESNPLGGLTFTYKLSNLQL